MGVSVESQRYTTRIDELLKIPAKVRFLSCEPLLGPLDIEPPCLNPCQRACHWVIVWRGVSGPRRRARWNSNGSRQIPEVAVHRSYECPVLPETVGGLSEQARRRQRAPRRAPLAGDAGMSDDCKALTTKGPHCTCYSAGPIRFPRWHAFMVEFPDRGTCCNCGERAPDG